MDFDIEAILRQNFGGPAGIMGQSARQKRRPGTKPKFIKLHPQDDGRGLDDVFFEGASEYAMDITVKLSVYPRTFVPPKNQYGEVQSWGVFPYGPDGRPDVDFMSTMNRRVRNICTFSVRCAHESR
jgi:hypothetical protein